MSGYTQQIDRTKPRLIEESKLWEKYTHHILRSIYDLMSIGEDEEPLYSYLVKAQKLQETYSEYKSSRNTTFEQEMLESIVEGESGEQKQQLKQLTFPFDQVSEGSFLAFFLEAFAGLQKGIYSSRLKKDVSYRIQYLKNLEFLLNVIYNDFKLDLPKHGIDADALTSNNYEAANDLFWLLFTCLRLERVIYKGKRNEEGLLQWASDCLAFYPGIDISNLQFEDGFSDGVAFCYIYHYYNAESVDLSRVLKEHPEENLKQAFEAGWKYCNIPHIIQNHNINWRSSIIYLYMMYESLHDKQRASFSTNQLSRIIRRKLEYEKLKNFFTDRAKTVLEDLRGMELDIKDIKRNRYLNRTQLDDISNQLLLEYKEDKASLLDDFLRVHSDSFYLACLEKSANNFVPYDPPNQLTVSNLYKVFDSLTPLERKYMEAYHNLMGIHIVVSDMAEDYTQTVDLLKTFTEEMSQKLVYLEVENKLESYQQLHSQVGDILVDFGQNKSLLRIVEFLDGHLEKHAVTPTPSYDDVLSMWNTVYQQAENVYKNMEQQMEFQIESEVMKLDFGFQLEGIALLISNAMWLLQAPYAGPDIARMLFIALDNFIQDKQKEIAALTEYEQKLVSNGQDLDITKDQVGEFLQDLIRLKSLKEDDMQDPLRGRDLKERLETNSSQIAKFVVDISSFLNDVTINPANPSSKQEPEEVLGKLMDKLHIYEKEKNQFGNTFNTFISSYTDYAETYDVGSIKFTDQNIQNLWNKMNEAFKVQKNVITSLDSQLEKIPTLRLTQQSEIQSVSQSLSQFKREPHVKNLDNSTLKLMEENFICKTSEILQISKRHIAITMPSCITPKVRKDSLFAFTNVFEGFIQYVDSVLRRWNRHTLDIANLVDVNKKRHASLQRHLTQSIQEASERIPNLKAIDDVLAEAKGYSQDYILLDQIEFLDEILSGSTADDENKERKSDFITLKGQWETLWDLIRSQVKKLIEGEGDVISPDLDFLNEKFKKTLENLKKKSALLDEEYKHEFRNLTKILKTISEIHADSHHARIFYELFLQQIHTLSEEEREKYSFSGFETLQKWIVEIRKEIEKDVLAAFVHEENKATYIRIADSIYETILHHIDELSSKASNFNFSTVEGIDKAYKDSYDAFIQLKEDFKEVERLVSTFGTQRDRPDIGSRSLEFLSNALSILYTLMERVRESGVVLHECSLHMNDMKEWIRLHIESIQEWIRTVENSIIMVDKISSVDDIFLSKRLLQHHLQESTYIQQQIRDIENKIAGLEKEGEVVVLGEMDIDYVKDSWDHLIPRLQQSVTTVEVLEQNFSSRSAFKSQLQMDIIRIGAFIEILKSKDIDRPTNFVGRITVKLLETYIDDCAVLQATMQKLPDLSRVQLETSDAHPFLIPIDRELEEMKYDYKQIRNRFEFILSETNHKLQAHLKAEKELHIMSNDYKRIAEPLLNAITSVEAEYGDLQSTNMTSNSLTGFGNNVKAIIQELAPSFEAIKKIHNNSATKIIESVPFDIMNSKWKRLCRISKSNGMRGEINIDNHKRKQELKHLILESSRQVSSWIDNALRTLQQTSNIPVSNSLNILHAQKIMHDVKVLNLEEEGVQYGKIIQILNQFTELVLIDDDDYSDIEGIIKSIERKWLTWMKESNIIMQRLSQVIEDLHILDYQKKNFHNMSLGILEWITLVTSELSRISNVDINDPTQIRVQTYHLAHWMKQKQAKIEIVRELEEICENMRVPDHELIKNMQEIKIRWSAMEQLAAEKQSLLVKSTARIEEMKTLNLAILSKHEEIVKWISFERDNLIHALKSHSSSVIQETLDNTRFRIKTEAVPILEYLQVQRNFAHKHLLDNHWNTFLFLLNRAKKRCDELITKEDRNQYKLETYQSKLELYFKSLSQLLEAVASIVDCSSKATTKEMDSALDDLIEVYSSMEGIVSEYTTLLSSIDSIAENELFLHYEVTNRFEKFCTECFSNFQELFVKYADDYESKMKVESITATYFSIYQAISDWVDVQKKVSSVLDGETLHLASISSRYSFYRDYFAQRQQITLMYHQLSDVWGILSSIGVVLEIQVPTPIDLKHVVENLDEVIGAQVTRIEDLIAQFDYVLTLRQQYIDTACNVSQFSHDAIMQLISGVFITTDDFLNTKSQLDQLRKKDKNTTSILTFLEELTQTILEECLLLPPNWDPYLNRVVETLKRYRAIFENLLINKEKLVERYEPMYNELSSAENVMKDMSTAILSYISDVTPKLRGLLGDVRLTRMDRLNQVHKYVSSHNSKSKYVIRLMDVVTKVKHAHWYSSSTSDNDNQAIVSEIWHEITAEWQSFSHLLHQCVQSISLLGDGIPSMKDSSDIQLFLEILYLNIWISDSCADLKSLLNYDLKREDVRDILFDMNILSREMEENQVILRRVVEVDPDSNEIVTLKETWTALQDLFSKAILKLTDHVMVKFHFEFDRGRVLSIHKSLSQFLEQNNNVYNPIFLSQEYNFYFVKMIPTHYENNLTLRNLFTTREIRALQEDFESMKQPFRENMTTEDNQEQLLERMRVLINESLKDLVAMAIKFTTRDFHSLDGSRSLRNIEEDKPLNRAGSGAGSGTGAGGASHSLKTSSFNVKIDTTIKKAFNHQSVPPLEESEDESDSSSFPLSETEDVLNTITQCCDELSRYSAADRLEPLVEFVQSLDDDYVSIHSSMLEFLLQFSKELTTHGIHLQDVLTKILNQHTAIQHIEKKFEQKMETLLEGLSQLEDLLERYTDEEDISSLVNIVSRNVNPSTTFVPKAEIAKRFLDKLAISPDENQKSFDILQTLKFEAENLSSLIVELCTLHFEKIIARVIPNRNEAATGPQSQSGPPSSLMSSSNSLSHGMIDNVQDRPPMSTKSTASTNSHGNGMHFGHAGGSTSTNLLENAFSRWESVVASIKSILSNLPLVDLEKSSRFIDIDYKELKRWFQEALQFFKTCQETQNNNELHDIQWTYLGTRMFKIRKDVMDDRYNRFVSILSPGDSSELMLAELNEKKEILEEKLPDLPDELDLQEKIQEALSFEHQQIRYGQSIEEANKWQEEFAHDIEQVQEIVSKLRASTTSLENLEHKFSEIEKGKELLSVFKDRFVKMDVFFANCESLYDNLQDNEFFTELFFTDLEPEIILQKNEEQKQLCKFLSNDIALIEKEYYEKLNQALQIIIKYNDLVKWNQESQGLLNMDVTIDSASMLDYARSRMKEWMLSYHEEWVGNYDSIMQTLSMQNHSLVFYIAYSTKYFALLTVHDFKKSWSNMLQSQKNREIQLDKLRQHMEDVDDKFHLPIEIVDPIQSTFMHFVHYNSKSSIRGVLHEKMLGDFLITLGLELEDDYAKQKEIALCMSYSSKTGGMADSVAFEDVMLYLTKHHLMIAQRYEDLILIFKRLERTRGPLTWERLATIIGTALNREQLQLLYTLIRFTGGGVDYHRLAEDMFA